MKAYGKPRGKGVLGYSWPPPPRMNQPTKQWRKRARQAWRKLVAALVGDQSS